MSPRPSPKRWTKATCYHEAGHAVIAVVLGGNLRRATVRPKGRVAGSVRVAQIPAWIAVLREGGNVWSHPRALSLALERMVGALAGGEAERQYTRRAYNALGATRDTGQVNQWLWLLVPESESREAGALWRFLRLRTRRLVRRHRLSIQAVADALYERGRLSASEIRKLVWESDLEARRVMPLEPLQGPERRELVIHIAALLSTLSDKQIALHLRDEPPSERRLWQEALRKLRKGEIVVSSDPPSEKPGNGGA